MDNTQMTVQEMGRRGGLARALKVEKELQRKWSARGGRKTHTHGVGAMGEGVFREKIKEMGLLFEDTHDSRPYDFIVNDWRVEIKTSNLSKSGKWCFDFTRNRGFFDFLVCIGVYEKTLTFLVIPAGEIGDRKALNFRPFANGKSWSKWYAFNRAWQPLLSPPNK